jgi:hypothetical protein
MDRLWESVGFDRNIFFVEPLKPNHDDIDLFIGREAETRTFLVDNFGSHRGLKFVSGHIGVGKTSFVNACQFYSYEQTCPVATPFRLPKLLPAVEKVQLEEESNVTDFFSQVILRIAQSIAFHCRSQSVAIPKLVDDLLNYFLEVRLPSGGGGGGISVGPFGGQITSQTQTWSAQFLHAGRHHVTNLVEIVKHDLKLDGISVVVNNLDILSREALIRFVNQTRDLAFDMDSVYWTLIGRKGMQSVIESSAPRVGDYVSGLELYMEPLPFRIAKAIIDRRVERFRKTLDATCPFSSGIIQTFHELSMRDTRQTFRICDQVFRRVITLNPTKVLVPDELAFSVFFDYAKERTRTLELTDGNRKLLEALFNHDGTWRPKEFGQFNYKSPQAFVSALKSLLNKRLLHVEEQGQARLYGLTGEAFLAGLAGEFGGGVQHELILRYRDTPSGEVVSPSYGTSQIEMELDRSS